ncbi:universal stress protein [Bermanella sp. WJH001]|uniref:universal stress protein n=1 Tax=Bermanella sp. WJH001 TaxID=3048005 RepID=UPI0024BE507D|nr:universal stress protein [Bermanella sp. WJH001]MDJ1536900.1 universal stress protein [Bermanella sp. WJH001]
MLAIKNVLLLLDQEVGNHNAIKRAMQICQEHDANLFVTTYVYNHACEEGSLSDLDMRHELKSMLLEQAQAWAENLFKELYLPADTPLSICWCRHAYQAVIDNSEDASFDLVIKAAAKHHNIVERVLQHQDWNLLKHCPAPVLLVKAKAAWEARTVIAAVDATSLDKSHKIINEHIFEFIEIINQDDKYNVHMVNSYPMLSLTLASLPDAPIPEDLQQYVVDQHTQACEILAEKYNIADDNIHIIEGEPEEAITKTAEKLDADVIVVGILNEEDLQSVILGSTVEHVLDSTHADVLAIKPQDGVIDID